jgi:parallel beta-helix repeat protein
MLRTPLPALAATRPHGILPLPRRVQRPGGRRPGRGVAALAVSLVLAGAACTGDRAPAPSPTPAPETPPAPTVRPLPAPPACRGRLVRVGADIQAAIDAAGPGGRLCLATGVHRLTAPLRPRTGQRIGGMRGAVLSGARPLTGWTRDRGSGRWFHAGDTRDPGRPVGECSDGTRACTYPDDVWRDDTRLRRVLSADQLRPGTVFIDYSADRIWVADDPAGARMELSVAPSAVRSGSNERGTARVRLTGLVIERFANAAQSAPAVEMGPGWVLDGLEVRENHGGGIDSGSGSVLRNSHIHHQGQLGLGGSGAVGALVVGNRIDHNNTAGYDPAWEAGGSKWAAGTRRLTVRGNHVFENNGPGLWTDGDNVDTTYERNLVEGNLGPGIIHEISYDAVIRGNTVRNNARAVAGRSIWWGSDIVVNSSQRVEISGNTVVSTVNAIGLIDTDRGAGRLGPYRVAQVDVHDNVIQMAAGAETGLVGRPTAFEPSAGVRFRGNTYHVPDPGGRFWQWEGDLDAQGWRDRGQDRDGSFLDM